MRIRTRLARIGAAGIDRIVRSPVCRGATGARFEVTVLVAGLLRWVDRRTDTRIDPSRAGRALLVAQPQALGRLADRLEAGCALISATNGKTTTTNLLAGIVRTAGHDPVVNHVGANMPGGLCAELIGVSRWGRVDADLGVFEVDELWLDHVVPPLTPRVISLGNLFRDQLDRMGELDRVAGRWRDFVERLDPSTVLVVNADDPRVCQLTAAHPTVVRYGVDDGRPGRPGPGTDVPDCLVCGGAIGYDTVHIGHLGRWRCGTCGDRRPDVDVAVTRIDVRGLDGCSFTLSSNVGDSVRDARTELRLPGRFNAANAAAAATTALVLGCAFDDVVAGLGAASGAFGRCERVDVAGCEVTMVLAKNPSGLDEVIEMLMSVEAPIDLLFLLNDRDLDGRDVSWVWDADVERLASLLGDVVCGGSRAWEAAMRLEYAGVPADRITVVEGIAEPLAAATARRRPLVALTNYSAMLDLRETVAEQGHAARYWW